MGKRKGESFISPAVQRERCEGLAAAGGHTIVAWHEDLDQSGGKADRPGFQAALARIESGESDGIVVAKLDRFARSVADAAEAMRRIEAAGGALLVAESSLDTSTPFGRFAMHMMLAMAELELERIRESWDTARASAVARGVHVASRTPTGYSRDESKRLVPNDDAPAISELFRRRARGASWKELGRLLTDAGVRTPYGAENWASRSLDNVLRNRVYLGEARSGEHVLENAHPPLIDEFTWHQAQRSKGARTPTSGTFLLSGLLRCAGCRYALTPGHMKDRDGTKLGLYRCRPQRPAGKCQAPASVLARLIEPWAEEAVFERAGDAAIDAQRESVDLQPLVDAVDTAREQVELYIAADIGGVVGAERYRAELERRQAALAAAETELATAGRQQGALPAGIDLVSSWPDLELGEKRHILAGTIDAIFLRRSTRQGLSALSDRALILWAGEGPDDLPGRGRKIGALAPFDW